MTKRGSLRCCRRAAVWLLPALVSAVMVCSARAEDSQTPSAGPDAGQQTTSPTTPPPPARGLFAAPAGAENPGLLPAQPPAVEEPGFLHQLGRWWGQSIGDFTAKMKDAQHKLGDINKQQNQAAKDAAAATQEVMKNAAEATKDAAASVVRLPSTRVLELSDRCQLAPNGAPDCQAAAVNACRSKGFNTGRPIDVRTSQECPARVLLSGRAPAEGECPDETVLLRAICQ